MDIELLTRKINKLRMIGIDCELRENSKGEAVLSILNITQNINRVVIPDGINIVRVRGNGADRDNNVGIKRLKLPDTITEIKKNTQFSVLGLEEIDIGKGCKKIGENAFSGCRRLKEIKMYDGLRYIGDSAFSYTGLHSVKIPESVNKIGRNIFESCINLENVTLPNGVSDIPDSAFEYCYRLKDIRLPNKLKRIGIRAFARCSELESISVPNECESIGEYAFNNCTRITNTNIPGSVEVIHEGCFHACVWLNKIEIEEGCRVIEKSAFEGCTSLTELKLPSTIKELGGRILKDSAVGELYVPYGCERIHRDAFDCAWLLDNVYVHRKFKDTDFNALESTKIGYYYG